MNRRVLDELLKSLEAGRARETRVLAELRAELESPAPERAAVERDADRILEVLYLQPHVDQCRIFKGQDCSCGLHTAASAAIRLRNDLLKRLDVAAARQSELATLQAQVEKLTNKLQGSGTAWQGVGDMMKESERLLAESRAREQQANLQAEADRAQRAALQAQVDALQAKLQGGASPPAYVVSELISPKGVIQFDPMSRTCVLHLRALLRAAKLWLSERFTHEAGGEEAALTAIWKTESPSLMALLRAHGNVAITSRLLVEMEDLLISVLLSRHARGDVPPDVLVRVAPTDMPQSPLPAPSHS